MAQSVIVIASIFSITVDKIWMLAVSGHVPDEPCSILAFISLTSATAQILLIIFIAVNSFSMVVLNKKIETGCFDCYLLSYSLGIPVIQHVVFVGLGYLGPSGAW